MALFNILQEQLSSYGCVMRSCLLSEQQSSTSVHAVSGSAGGISMKQMVPVSTRRSWVGSCPYLSTPTLSGTLGTGTQHWNVANPGESPEDLLRPWNRLTGSWEHACQCLLFIFAGRVGVTMRRCRPHCHKPSNGSFSSSASSWTSNQHVCMKKCWRWNAACSLTTREPWMNQDFQGASWIHKHWNDVNTWTFMSETIFFKNKQIYFVFFFLM